MELDKLFIELWHNLYKPFIFYIPKSLIPEEKKVLWQEKKIDVYFNTVILIDSKGFDSELQEQLSNHKMMAKSMVLNENMFKLIEKSGSLKEEQFSFFLAKYMEHVNFVVYVSDWLQRNVVADIKGLREETKNAFQSQADVFLKHLEELRSKILTTGQTIPKQEVNVLEFIENDLAEIKNALSLNKDSESTNGAIERDKVTPTNKPKKTLPLLTDQEAETFLLETVFNIKQG